MLSIGKLGRGQENYYLSTVAKGVEDYYTGAGEAAGEWMGTGASRLHLSGEVSPEQLRMALGGLDPTSGEELGGRTRRDRVPGWDLTFSAPKSVSVLWALGGEEVAAAAVEAHRQAVAAGLSYLESRATVSRRRVEGRVEAIRGEGLVVAAFRHRTSRAGDPHLHTHCLAANLVERVDGGWGALHSPVVYRHARTAGFVYQAVLRSELTLSLGLSWGEVHNGCAEVDGVDPRLVEHFSTRRAEIAQAMAERGESSRWAGRVATLDTRRAKDYGVDPETLTQRWAAEAAELGPEVADVTGALGQRAPVVQAEHLEAVAEELVAPTGLTAERASFDRRDVLRAWCSALPPGARVDLEALEELTEGFLEEDEVVPVITGVPAGRQVLRDAQGRPVSPVAVERRWSTTEMLDTERRLLERAQGSRGVGAGRVEPAVVESRLGTTPSLSGEQAAMVRAVCGSGDGVEVVVGRAGTGKTYALAAAASVWRAGGYEPVGLALAARAAADLEATAGIPSVTVAQFLADSASAGGLLHERHVVVVDEAAMVDTRRLGAVLAQAQAAGAKVVLVGDHHQLPPVEAGGAFAALVSRLGATELCENRRQVNAWEREALDQLRSAEGRDGIVAAVERYDGAGRIHVGDCPATVRAAMVDDWYGARAEGESVVMLALRRADVAELNARARALLVADTTVATDGLAVGERTFALGDRVVCLHNDRLIGVTNALFATVVDIDEQERSVTLETETNGRRVVVPERYLAEGHLDHAYATTIHKAQGATYDRMLLLGDDRLYRQAGYTGLSRGRARNDVYLVADDDRDLDVELEGHGPAASDGPQDRLVRTLGRDGAKVLATDEAGVIWEPAAWPSLRELWRERDRLAEELAGMSRAASLPDTIEGARAQVAALEVGWEAVEERDGSTPGCRRDPQLQHLALRHREATESLSTLQPAGAESSGGAADLDDSRRQELNHRLDRLDHALEWRTVVAARAVEVERPAHLVDLLGNPPVDLAGRQRWREAAGAVESFLARWQIDADDLTATIPRTDEQATDLERLGNLIEGLDAGGRPDVEFAELA